MCKTQPFIFCIKYKTFTVELHIVLHQLELLY